MDFTAFYTRIMADVLYESMIAQDRDRTKFEPFTPDECKAAAIARVSKIRAHNRKNYREIEEFAVYFYTEANYKTIADMCNKMLEAAWPWD
jgi:hypothetical protein